MSRLKDTILNFDLGVRSNDKLIIFGLFFLYFFFGYMIKDTTRLFWMHWIGAYLIGLLVFYLGSRGVKNKSLKNAFTFLFPKDIWTNPSAINDCIIAVLNAFLARFLYASFSLIPFAAVTYGGFWVGNFFALEQSMEIPSAGIVFLFTVFMVVAADFSYYWAHRWAHEIPVWWEFHKVHHSAEVMTPITLLRYHPLDDLVYAIIRRLGQGFASGFFLYLYPSTPGVITILSTNIIVFVFDFLGSNLRHSHIWLSYGSRLEKVLISPALHHIHHSDNPKHFDKNYGAIFALWDWMFGTLYVPEGKEDITFGIGKDKETEHYDTVPKLYLNPFIRAYQLIKK